MQQTEQAAITFAVEEAARRLRDSFATLEWAVANVPARWTHELPDYYSPEEWSVAQILAHVAVYETEIAAPLLEELAAGRDGTAVEWSGEGSTNAAAALA